MKRKMLTLLVMMIIGLSYLGNVNAMTDEQHDTHDSHKLKIPDIVSPNGTAIDDSKLSQDYTMYYQWILMEDEDISKIKDLHYKNLEATLQLLEYGISIKADMNSSEVSVPEEGKEAYELSVKTNEEYLALIPFFDENNWQEAIDKNKVKYPEDGKSYTLWIKTTEPNDIVSYKYRVFENNATPAETTMEQCLELYEKYGIGQSESEENDISNNIESNVENNVINDSNSTTQTSENPNTGIEDCTTYLVPLALVFGTVLTLTRKHRRA